MWSVGGVRLDEVYAACARACMINRVDRWASANAPEPAGAAFLHAEADGLISQCVEGVSVRSGVYRSNGRTTVWCELARPELERWIRPSGTSCACSAKTGPVGSIGAVEGANVGSWPSWYRGTRAERTRSLSGDVESVAQQRLSAQTEPRIIPRAGRTGECDQAPACGSA
jgi:hypothetical protein